MSVEIVLSPQPGQAGGRCDCADSRPLVLDSDRRSRERAPANGRRYVVARSFGIGGDDRGCRRLFLETLDYQAPEFYEARGYVRQCELVDWDSHGHSKYIYVKVLEARQIP
jgi:hypothetical protein